MSGRLAALLSSCIAALLVAGCAATSIPSAWYDTGYTGGPFRKIVVIGELRARGLLAAPK